MMLTMSQMEELDELREEVRQLRQQLAEALIPKPFPVFVGIRLSPSERFYLSMIVMAKGFCDKNRMMAAWKIDCENRRVEKMADGSKAIDVTICRLRVKLREIGVTLETGFGVGWRLSDEDKAVLLGTAP